MQREPEEPFGFCDVNRIDSIGRGGPGFGSFALEAVPAWKEPAPQKESEPDVKKPRPGVGLGPAKGCIEADKTGCGKTVECKAHLICRLLLQMKRSTATQAVGVGAEELEEAEVPEEYSSGASYGVQNRT